MKNILASILAVLSWFSVLAQEPGYIPGDLLVMLRPGASIEELAADLGRFADGPADVRVVREVSAPMRTWLLHFSGTDLRQDVMLGVVRSHPAVLLAQNNHIVRERAVPDDTEYAQQWQHQNIDSEVAWDVNTGGVTASGDTIVVCIIEDAELPHPDLIANAWFNHAEIPNNDIDDDGNGYVDDFRGWNAPNGNDEVYGGGHGTQVAGMIGAVGNNAMGVVGANWAVKMMAVEYGGVQEAMVVAAYTYPLVMRRRYNDSNGAEGAFVVATNASWGINGGDPADAPIWCAMYDSLGTEGVLSCGATANNDVDVDVVGDLPTACGSEFLVSVTATDIDDNRTFAGYGLTTIDVGAPGVNVRTTSITGGYNNANGTSFASPLTAGVIGLLYSAPCETMMDLVHADPAAGAQFVRDRLFEGVDQVGNLPGQTVTGGRINAGNSMQLIINSCVSCPPPYGLTVINNDIGISTLGWSAVGGTTFDLHYRAVGSPDWIEMNGLVNTQFVASGLAICTLYEFEVLVHCGGEQSVYSNTFTWTSEGCCTTPEGLAAGFVGADLANVFWNDVIAANSFEVQYRPLSGGAWSQISNITNASAEIPGLQPCTAYEAQVRTVCDGPATEWSASVEFQTLGCGACIDNSFCTSEGASSTSEFIARVQLGAIDNTSGNDGGYGDHTGNTTDLLIGQSTPITLTPGFGFFTFPEYFTVWVDLDQDGQFLGPNELVFDPGAPSETATSGMLIIPGTATAGPVRLRVVMQYNAAVPDGCTNYDFGETEDYCVNLLEFVSINEEAQDVAVNIYPSPADDEISIVFTGTQSGRILELEALDNSGRIVRRTLMPGGRAVLDTATLANGIYHYRISADGRALVTGRFAVVH